MSIKYTHNRSYRDFNDEYIKDENLKAPKKKLNLTSRVKKFISSIFKK